MQSPEQNLLKRIETHMPILVGIGEILIGIIIILMNRIYLYQRVFASADIGGVLSDVGVGLVAAGIITITLEPFSRKRLQSDINEIKKANFEALLKGVMPEPIFVQVQNHIIRQPFLRENVRTTFVFEWRDKERTIVRKTSTAQYSITNISSTIQTYDLTASHDIDLGTEFHDEVKITEIVVKQNGMERDYDEPKIKTVEVRNDQFVEVHIPLPLLPGEMANITIKSQNILPNRYHIYVVLVPTINFELGIIHEEDMIIKVSPLHPSRSCFKSEVISTRFKSWKIEGGLLPMQGFEVTWIRADEVHNKEEPSA